jgi:hypothetical protein
VVAATLRADDFLIACHAANNTTNYRFNPLPTPDKSAAKKTFYDEVAIKNELKESRYTVVDINYSKP